MSTLNAARERTEAKLKYATIHLEELRLRRALDPSQGGDFERAHQEAFLFHLLGVRDALFQEINIFYDCGLEMNEVTKKALSDALRVKSEPSPAFEAITELESDESSWIEIARRMRNQLTHQKNVSQHFTSDERKEVIHLKDPLTEKWIEQDYMDLFSNWWTAMRDLVTQLQEKMPGAESD